MTTKKPRRLSVAKLERDVEWFAEELQRSRLSREIEVRLYKEKLDEVIDQFNTDTQSTKQYIDSLHQKIQRLELDLRLKEEGFCPGHPDDPYIDVSTLMEFPALLKNVES